MLSVRYSIIIFAYFLVACAGARNSEDPSEFAVSDSLQTRPDAAERNILLTRNRISEYDAIIKKYSRRYGFDWRLIAAQIFVESRFEIKARSGKGALGLMQIMPGTARHLGTDTGKLLKPEQNIALGCLYDRRLYSLWKKKEGTNRLAFTFASYNAGRTRVLRAARNAESPHVWTGVRPHVPNETRNYVGRIFGKYAEYKKEFF